LHHILYDIFQLVINLWAISGVKMLVDVPYRFYQYVAEFNDLLCSVAVQTLIQSELRRLDGEDDDGVTCGCLFYRSFPIVI
jgi:hypothetical protein